MSSKVWSVRSNGGRMKFRNETAEVSTIRNLTPYWVTSVPIPILLGWTGDWGPYGLYQLHRNEVSSRNIKTYKCPTLKNSSAHYLLSNDQFNTRGIIYKGKQILGENKDGVRKVNRVGSFASNGPFREDRWIGLNQRKKDVKSSWEENRIKINT